MDQKESRIASAWVFIYCIHSQWQSGALTRSHRDWQTVTTSWQEKQREREPGEISHLPRFQQLQNHSHGWRSLMWPWMFSALLHPPAQPQARHERCSPFSEPALQWAHNLQGNYVTPRSQINSIIKQHHMSLLSSWKHGIDLVW